MDEMNEFTLELDKAIIETDTLSNNKFMHNRKDIILRNQALLLKAALVLVPSSDNMSVKLKDILTDSNIMDLTTTIVDGLCEMDKPQLLLSAYEVGSMSQIIDNVIHKYISNYDKETE